MTSFTTADLKSLAGDQRGRCASIFMPWSNSAEENRVRLKNLVREAKARLEDQCTCEVGQRCPSTWEDALLQRPAAFWETPASGLAIFVAENEVRTWFTRVALAEECFVGPRFHIVPMIASARDPAANYILAMSQKSVRLLRAENDQLIPCEVDNLPTGIAEVLHADSRDGQSQVHVRQPGLGKEGVVFHGQGGAPDLHKKNLTSYFRLVDREVCDHLADANLPLVFAGVDYLFPLFQAVCGYHRLAAAHVSGNVDAMAGSELLEKTSAIVIAERHNDGESQRLEYGQLSARARTTNLVAEIVSAASAGIVETLFVDPAVRKAGSFSPTTCQVLIGENQHSAEDLVNLAACFVLRHGGTVEVCRDGHIPGGGPMAAVLRYAALPLAGAENRAV